MISTKILCLGNNDDGTDHWVSALAQEHQSTNHGLVTDSEYVPVQSGYYHTTVMDIPWGNLFKVAQRFDTVIMLDQPRNEWSHWKCLLATYKFMVELEKTGKTTIFRDNKNTEKFIYWSDLLTKQNKSFCIYPWINMYSQNQDLKLCARSDPTITTLHELKNWSSDPKFTEIRQKMLAGELLPDHCGVCYTKYEQQGIESYRQFESLDWVVQLDLSSVDDLQNIKHPYYYEVNAGDNCNIKCRGCTPAHSRPIAIEAKKFNIVAPKPLPWKVPSVSTDHIDIDLLTDYSTVYFQGGEPTIMPEVADFLKQCIEKNKTDFNLSMCTNGVKISDSFVELLNHFSKASISFSIDGFGKVNDYWRSGSKWEKVIANARLLESLGHKININTVPGIYNVTNLHLLFEFLDREFPFTTVYLQLNYNQWQSAFNHPDTAAVIASMEKCMNTAMYRSNGKSCKSSIDGLHQYYSNNPTFNVDHLKQFFNYNDQLDRARGVKLGDYIPELEACRKFIL